MPINDVFEIEEVFSYVLLFDIDLIEFMNLIVARSLSPY